MTRRLARSIVAGFIVVLLLLGCCLGASNSTIAPSGVPQAPDEARLKEILKDFEQYAEKGMNDWKVPGMAVAIVRGNETIYLKPFGVKKVNSSDPVTPNTIFQIGSTSKAFTAALVAMQVDAGKVKWDDRVIDHLSDFEMYDPWVTREFTVTDLMAQRSGLPGYSGGDLVTLGYDRGYLERSLRYTKPETSFRSAYAYQNTLFLTTAELVENLTNKSWEENIQKKIFQPLGMSNSSVDMKSFQQAKDVAYLHQIRNGRVTALPMDWKYMDWPYIYGPAGGINSDIIDMTKWLRLQMHNGSFEGKQLISENSTIYMHSPKTIISPMASASNVYYCQGWIYQESKPYPIIWHNGGTLGHHTMVAFVPQADIGIVVLSNIDSALPESLAYRFFDQYFGNPAKDYSAKALVQTKEAEEQANASIPKQPTSLDPALPLERYVGNYSDQTYGRINISQENGSLVATAGPRNVKILLTPWDRDIFRTSEPELSDQKGFARFQIGPDGLADNLEMIGGVFTSKVTFEKGT